MPDSNNCSRFVLLTLIFVLAWNFTSSIVGWGWPTAAVITFGMSLVYGWYAGHFQPQFFEKTAITVIILGS